MDRPQTQYARTVDGVHLAYQVVGDGPFDLALMPEGIGHIDLAWEVAAFARVFRRLASFSRVILFDHRGTGLSDPLGLSDQPSLEQRAEDVLAVLDAARSDRAAVVANSIGGPMAIFFAATHPTRTASLVLDGCYARLARAPNYPWGVPDATLARAVDQIEQARRSGDDIEAAGLRHTAPTALDDPDFLAHRQHITRYTSRPGTVRAEAEMLVYADVRPLLPTVQAPTLVLYRRDDRFAGKPHAQYLSTHIAEAKLVEVPGEDNLMFVGDNDADLDEIEEFLTGTRHAVDTDRVLATVLFTDIVGSTDRAAELGDRRWRELLDRHDAAVRRQLERFRGREVKTVGDGFVATFDGPRRAIQCACAIRDAVSAVGLDMRAGVHTGEVEVRGDDIGGIAVHTGARVASLAQAGEVLVSSTVKDLVAGSSIEFGDRGEHELKGVPGRWRVFAVEFAAG